ncbi:hypothetical protein [Yersinia intermedia]|uniref:hypothetical protein n=1 Tax=Yersinia intermedia TaxID=631 RepID=UPI001CFCD70F|nr:hypothetical protein [Yersinia intermedia]MCB5313314.1 hypothetical protein [Yersinia intermedia]
MDDLSWCFGLMCEQYARIRDELHQEIKPDKWPAGRKMRKELSLLNDDNQEVKGYLDEALSKYSMCNDAIIVSRPQLDIELSRLRANGWIKGLNENFRLNLLLAGIEYQWAKAAWNYDKRLSVQALNVALMLLHEFSGACMCCELIDGEREIHAVKVKAAAKGGVTKAEVYNPIIKEAIRLLQSTSQTGEKWKHWTDAAKAIEQPLWSFIAEQKVDNQTIDLKEENLVGKIQLWGKKDIELGTTLNEKVLKPKKLLS